MKTHFKFVCFIALLCIAFKGFTQPCTTPVSSCTINTVLSPGDYKARDKVTAEDGAQAHPSGIEKMHLFIDENMVLPTTYSTAPAPAPGTYNINTSLPVGAISSSVDVSQSGAANCNIPVFIPPGTAGMTPSVSIVYSSQGGSGLLGIGWDIAGLSAITRIGRTVYHDGSVGPVMLNATDNFALDGNRLIPVAGSSDYRTENETFSIITQHNSGSTPNYFTVLTKDGKTLEYGNTLDSKQIPPGSTNGVILIWRLNKVIDENGNYLTYTYHNENGEVVLQKIDYTGTTTFLPYNSIQFFYSSRTDQNSFNVAGYNIPKNLLLDRIKSVANGNTLREYNCQYFYDPVTGSHLSTVSETGSDGTQLNNTAITWDVSSQSGLPDPNSNSGLISLTKVPNTNFANIQYPGDYNGDGLTDILVVHSVVKNGGTIIDNGLTWELYLNNSIGIIGPISTGQFPSGFSHYVAWGKESPSFNTVDVNGDGMEDLIIPTLDNDDNYGAMLSTSIGFGSPDYFKPSCGPDEHHYELLGDFDGDGTTDIFVYYYDQDIWYVHSWKTTLTYTGSADWGDASLSFNTVDFDGDGKSEILFTLNNPWGPSPAGWNDYYYIFGLNAASGGLDVISHGAFPSSCEGEDRNIFPGDFNGDGTTDLLTYDYCSPQGVGSWLIGYAENTSAAGTPKQYLSYSAPLYNFGNPKDLTNRNYLVADFNGDGKSDIAMITDNISNKVVTIYYSTGNNNFYLAPDIIISSADWPDIKLARIGDYNGDGHSDIIYPGFASNNNTGQTCHAIYFKCSGSNGTTAVYNDYNKVTSITNGFNQTTYFDYNTLPELAYKNLGSTESYIKGTGAVFPVVDLQQPLAVVSKVKTDDGIGGYITTQYRYEGAKAHINGKGFLGFSKFTTDNITTGFTSTTEFELIPDVFLPTVIETTTYKAGMPLEINTNSNYQIIYTTNAINSKNAFFAYSGTQDAFDYLSGKRVITNSSCNADGNVTSSNSESWLSGGVSAMHIFNTVTNTYIAAGNSVIPNKISHTSTAQIYGTQSAYTRSTDFNYDNVGNLTDQIGDNGVNTHFVYNTCGLPTTVKVSALGLPDIINTNVYDTKNRFVVKSINPALDESFKSYNDDGTLISETDINGLSNLYYYDGFSRLIKVYTPQQHAIITSRNWNTSTANANILWDVTLNAPGRPTSKTFYDKAGRELAAQIEGFNGNLINTEKVFNNIGQLTLETKPFYTGDPKKWIQYGYDNYNRPNSVNDGNKIINTTYDIGARITINTPGNAYYSEKNYDAAGNLIYAIDNGGVIIYDYNSQGNVKSIKTGGATTTLTYDNFGMQATLTDPDAGLSTYRHNAYGQLTYQQDANLNTYDVFNYDNLGRLTYKHGTEGDYTYQYYTTGDGKELLQTATGPSPIGNVTQDFQYNKYGNTTSFTETVGGKTLTTQYEYNQFGNVSKQTYPSGFQIENHYDNKGNLINITRPIVTGDIWRLNNENVLGQPTDIGLGGLHTYYSYNSNTDYLNGIITPNLQNLTYDFEATTGNLINRTTNNINEVFDYDFLNRLKNITINNGTAATIAFANNGNINSKPDAGIYSYLAKPHAVTKLTNLAVPITISHDQQDISYTAFNKINQIIETNLQLDFTYSPDQQRIKTVLKTTVGAVLKTKYFTTNYEEEITPTGTRKLNYITSPTGLAAIYIDDGSNPQMYYVLKDHLGSITGLVKNEILVEAYSYDAWGRRRDPNSATGECYTVTNTPAFIISRGYTGHEHLDEFGLINMNGRLYDPILGRMLSPDNYVQAAENTQSYNRYSYCWNNPLTNTDPDGQWINFAIGGIMGGFSGWQIGEAAGAKGWNMFGYIAAGIAIGAASTGAAAGISAIGGGAFIAGAGAGAIASAGFSGLATNWNKDAMIRAGAIGGISGGLGGCVGAAIGGGGGAFAGGAVGSGVSAALNGGSIEDVSKSALVGGGISLAVYYGSSKANYELRGGNKFGDVDLTFKQYLTIQADFQRSRFYHKEYGGLLMEDGSVIRFGPEQRANYKINDIKYPAAGVKAMYHTHWDAPDNVIFTDSRGNSIHPSSYTGPLQTTERYHTPGDLLSKRNTLVINRFDGSYSSGNGAYSVINPPINRFIYSFWFW